MARTFGQFADSLRKATGTPAPAHFPAKPAPETAAAQAAQAPPVPAEPDSVLDAPAAEPEAGAAAEGDDTEHATLMHELGSAIKTMMEQDPETHKSISDLMQEFMGKGIDFDAESKRLRGLIEARPTPKAPNWLAAGVGSWAGGQQAAGRFAALQQAAAGAEHQKQADIEDTEASLLKEHVEDLRSRGKTKEALLMGLMQGVMGQRKTETQEAAKGERQKDLLASRADLQERALGAAEERVRIQVNNRRDVADKDRTAAQVFHLYESLLRQTEKDITGAVKPIYTADEAMNLALNTILPAIKQGVETAKTGVVPEPEIPVATPNTPKPGSKGGSKFAQWKSQQAAKPGVPTKKD